MKACHPKVLKVKPPRESYTPLGAFILGGGETRNTQEFKRKPTDEQEYFGHGITEDIITNLELSRIFVVSSNSTFLHKGKQLEIEQVARELGVRHVLEGSVRRAANRVRITVQLIEG